MCISEIQLCSHCLYLCTHWHSLRPNLSLNYFDILWWHQVQNTSACWVSPKIKIDIKLNLLVRITYYIFKEIVKNRFAIKHYPCIIASTNPLDLLDIASYKEYLWELHFWLYKYGVHYCSQFLLVLTFFLWDEGRKIYFIFFPHELFTWTMLQEKGCAKYQYTKGSNCSARLMASQKLLTVQLTISKKLKTEWTMTIKSEN